MHIDVFCFLNEQFGLHEKFAELGAKCSVGFSLDIALCFPRRGFCYN